MRVYDKLPIVAFCALVILIVLAGPLMGLLHTVHIDPSTIAIAIGLVAGICVLFVFFKPNISDMFHLLGSRLSRLEDEITGYPVLSPGKSLLEDEGYYFEDEESASAIASSSTVTLIDEPVLQLASNCPLPISSGLNNSLILEHPGVGRQNRSIATRLYIELFGQYGLPQQGNRI